MRSASWCTCCDYGSAFRFARSRASRCRGYGEMIEWSKLIEAPTDAEEFACRVIYVICNSGMRVTIGAAIAQQVPSSVSRGPCGTGRFGHPGKAAAIEAFGIRAEALFEEYHRAIAKLKVLRGLPWIGPVTQHHLGQEPRRHRQPNPTSTWCVWRKHEAQHRRGCADDWRGSRVTRFRRSIRFYGGPVPTGMLDSRKYELEGWDAAFQRHAQFSNCREPNLIAAHG